MDNEKETMHPNYYGILPANVRYCKAIAPAAKVLFTELSALTNKNGYCHASNQYFADLYEVSTRIISNWFKQLEENGFIRIELYKTQIGTLRKIYINVENQTIDMQRKKYSSAQENIYSNAHMKEYSEPQEEKFVLNNNNINTNNLNNKKKNAEKSARFKNENIDDVILEEEPLKKPKIKTQSKKENSGFSISIWPANFPPELIPHAERFLEYRKEIKKPYKSQSSLQTKLNQFVEQFEKYGIEAVKSSIETAIAQGWTGTFIDKKYTNTSKQSGYGTSNQQQQPYQSRFERSVRFHFDEDSNTDTPF